ncbi:MAG: hypothetical protein ACXU86_05840 [Archangium sp.]
MLLFSNPASEAYGCESSPVTIESGLWPLLVVRFGPSSSLQDLEMYLAARTTWLERCEPHVCIVDAREVHLTPVSLRKHYLDWVSKHEAALRRWMLGTAYIIQSPAVRMMVSVIRHLAPMSMPFFIAGTPPPAAAWAAERLQEAGLTQAATRVRAGYAIPAS